MKNQKHYIPQHLPAILLCFVFIIFISCRKKEILQPGIVSPVDTISDTNVDTTKLPTDTLLIGKTFLALGDSYTIGQSVDSSERFPAQTAALLSVQNIRFSTIQYIARTGWTTLNLKDAINTQQLKGPFDAVTLLIGVNDQYQTHDTANYRNRFTDLLNTSVSLAGNNQQHVFVLSIPDYGVTPFGGNIKDISDQIDQFNTINKDVTNSYGVHYIDVTTISRNNAGDASMIAIDGLHPSGKEYAQWAKALDSVMYETLK